MDPKMRQARDILVRQREQVEEDKKRLDAAIRALDGRRPGRRPGSRNKPQAERSEAPTQDAAA